jgi:TolB-like protein/DNA-binding winged helix-turn-helix (wHTH) protein/Flp pilus assembly protein TadD
MIPQPIKVRQPIRFGEDFEVDLAARRLQRGSHPLKLERIPLEILVLLLEHRGEIVTRDEIVAKVWGTSVFLDTDNSIRGAVRKIRQVLKDNPEFPRFIQTVTGQGYRFIAPVVNPEEENGADVSTVGREKESQGDTRGLVEADRRLRTQRSVRWLVAGAAAVLALLASTYVIFRGHAAGANAPKINSLAVLPLKNLTGDPSQEYFADGMTEELISRLSTIRGLRVVSRTSVMQFKDARIAVPQIARALGVDALVEGSVIRDGDRVRVHAQLIRGATDEHFWSETYDRELGHALGLESDIAQAIAAKVQVTVTGEERERLAAAPHVAPEVYESYLKGQGQFRNGRSRADLEKSLAFFEDAIHKDPTFAPAYLGVATAYDRLGTVFVGLPPQEARAKGMAAARKALELDPDLAQAHVLLAVVYQRQWQWSDAETEFKWALRLRPNDAAAHLGMAKWLLAEGRTEEAMEWSKRARELDPLAVTGTDLAWILFSAHRYEEAIRELHATLAVRPDDALALWYLGFSFVGKGSPQDAIPPLERAVSISDGSPGAIGVLARAYGHAGRRSEALRLIDGLSRRRQKEYVPTAPFVQAYVGLGDYDQAFAWFERAYQEKSNILQWIKVEPFPDAMRNDPRFTDLLHRVGLD